jgi:hypothetical protein
MSYITSDPFALGSLITLMMEAARTSETSVDIQLTRKYIPEDSELELKPLKTIVFVNTYFSPCWAIISNNRYQETAYLYMSKI